MFPNKLSIKDLDKNELTKDVSKSTDLDLQIFKSNDSRTKKNLKDKIQFTFNEEYNDFWTQDFSKLRFSFDKEDIYFWIKKTELLINLVTKAKADNDICHFI